jgi:hypothetical protein
LKQFNKTISIEVEVDTIAQQLLDSMALDSKHRELIVEAVIATGLNNGSLNHIFNALNGHRPSVNFQLGEYVISDYKTWKGSAREPIGRCIISEIDEYTNYLTVSYELFDSEGKMSVDSKSVPMSTCSKVPLAVVI